MVAFWNRIYWNAEICTKQVHSCNSSVIALGGAPTFTFIFIFYINGFLIRAAGKNMHNVHNYPAQDNKRCKSSSELKRTSVVTLDAGSEGWIGCVWKRLSCMLVYSPKFVKIFLWEFLEIAHQHRSGSFIMQKLPSTVVGLGLWGILVDWL